MKKLILLVFVVLSLNAGIKNEPALDTKMLDKMSIEKILSTMANSVSKALPMVIDELTTVTRVYSHKNEIVYIKMINIGDPRFEGISTKHNSPFHQAMFKLDAQIVCNERLFKYLMDTKNAIVEYKYVDMKNKPLFKHTVEKVDCGTI